MVKTMCDFFLNKFKQVSPVRQSLMECIVYFRSRCVLSHSGNEYCCTREHCCTQMLFTTNYSTV